MYAQNSLRVIKKEFCAASGNEKIDEQVSLVPTREEKWDIFNHSESGLESSVSSSDPLDIEDDLKYVT